MLIAIILLICIATSVSPTQEVRDNKVWSLNINIDYCGVKVIDSKFAEYNYETGELTNIRKFNVRNSIIQWGWIEQEGIKLKEYTSADLITEMGQQIYFMEIIGYTDEEIPSWVYHRYWISPFGLGSKPMPPAPMRYMPDGEWNEDDQAMLVRWFRRYHSWTSPSIWKSIRQLSWKFDARDTVNIIIGTKKCLNA